MHNYSVTLDHIITETRIGEAIWIALFLFCTNYQNLSTCNDMKQKWTHSKTVNDLQLLALKLTSQLTHKSSTLLLPPFSAFIAD